MAIIGAPGAYLDGLRPAFERAGMTLVGQDDEDAQVSLVFLESTQLPSGLGAFVEGDQPVVAAVREPTADVYRVAIEAGAQGVVGWFEKPGHQVLAVRACLMERLVIPLDVAVQSLLSRAAERPPALTEQDVEWLNNLAGGVSVAQLAKNVGWSEREMHRRLLGLYQRLGVQNRHEALVAAGRQGLA